MRLDNYLVEKNYFPTRSKAQIAIKNRNIYCDDKCITKNSYQVDETNNIEIQGEVLKYVSKGGLKLEKAINNFNIDLKDKIMCDIGSSTGGFSDCAIENGVGKIYAIDVGNDQMDEKVKNDKRVNLYENTDFRDIDENAFSDIEIVTIDVSFISVSKLLNKINQFRNIREIVCLVKPQFECGMEVAHKYKGVVNSKQIHFEVISKVINAFKDIDFNVSGLTFSPIQGGSGNIEYLLYLTKNNLKYTYNINDVIKEAFNNFK